MDVLPLPPGPSLEQYRKRAKDLVKAAKSADAGAVRTWATEWLETLARLRGVSITPFVQGSIDRAIEAIEKRVRENVSESRHTVAGLALADAQYLIARAHGFDDWPGFAKHLERVSQEGSESQVFESAADAVVSGDIGTLEALVRWHPGLLRDRSTRAHRATLLHYVSANGVEDFRQRTPPNAPVVARLLLDAGAEVDVLANTYGGGSDQTTMNLLVSSTHPARAGLQGTLVETLLDFGAAINGLGNDGSPLLTALAFGYAEAAETLARRGARVDSVIAAAALGRVDLVRGFVRDQNTLGPGQPVMAPLWLRMPPDAQAHIEFAFVGACKFGRTAVVDLLLEKGVDPAAKDGDAMTGLHWAAAYEHSGVIELLLQRGAPLEVKNRWGGTVLDSTVYFALHAPVDGVNYSTVIDTLIAAGADIKAVTPFPIGDRLIDETLRRHGARPG